MGRASNAGDSSQALPACTLAVAREVTEGVAICRDGRIRWASARLAEIVGASSSRGLEGSTPDSLFESSAPDGVDGAKGRLVSGAEVKVWRFEGEVPSEEVWVIHPHSEQEALRDQLGGVRRELAELQCEAAALRGRLKRELGEREELLTIVSHELRTPVTVITGYNRLLLSDEVGSLTEEQREFLEESTKSCRRLDGFIANLLKASHAGTVEQPLALRSASIATVVEGVVAFLRPLLDEHELDVAIDLDADALECRFDPTRIEQVITNLLGNAIKYTPPGSSVVVESHARACADGRFVEVSVLDDGPGVASDERDRIFDPYVRAKDETRASGLGLGLAICRRIVEAHGGVIGVSDRECGGSRFHFTLPAEDAAVRAER